MDRAVFPAIPTRQTQRAFPLILSAILLLPMTAGLGGCAMGNAAIAKEDTASLQQKIFKGRTTKTQVQAMFGEPSERGTKNGREYWMYRLQSASAKTFIPFVNLATGDSGTEIKDLVIDFDAAGGGSNYDLVVFKG